MTIRSTHQIFISLGNGRRTHPIYGLGMDSPFVVLVSEFLLLEHLAALAVVSDWPREGAYDSVILMRPAFPRFNSVALRRGKVRF